MSYVIYPTESVLGEDYVDQMLTEMRHSLPSANEQKTLTAEQVNRCVTFVCDVATNFYSNIKVSAFFTLVFST